MACSESPNGVLTGCHFIEENELGKVRSLMHLSAAGKPNGFDYTNCVSGKFHICPRCMEIGNLFSYLYDQREMRLKACASIAPDKT